MTGIIVAGLPGPVASMIVGIGYLRVAFLLITPITATLLEFAVACPGDWFPYGVAVRPTFISPRNVRDKDDRTPVETLGTASTLIAVRRYKQVSTIMNRAAFGLDVQAVKGPMSKTGQSFLERQKMKSLCLVVD